ncbi:hypothetical protein FH972_021509 [Carpinus fangiana]|uniref:phosphoinositide 5-phosphatase n=1 Tax=Carpinus fangiana TaxID=176857 RepID=A0A5N6KRQ1_9ROSI|nr:hypothetical protein FH972_021509 [Carpinus fangiana]
MARILHRSGALLFPPHKNLVTYIQTQKRSMKLFSDIHMTIYFLIQIFVLQSGTGVAAWRLQIRSSPDSLYSPCAHTSSYCGIARSQPRRLETSYIPCSTVVLGLHSLLHSAHEKHLTSICRAKTAHATAQVVKDVTATTALVSLPKPPSHSASPRDARCQMRNKPVEQKETGACSDRERAEDSSSEDFDAFEKGYLWNSYMIKPLVDFRSRLSAQERKDLDSTRLLTSAIRGFAHTVAIPTPYSLSETNRVGPPSTMTLISRLSCLRAGTRFNARGVDDDGNVANFVESETIFWSPSGICFSYVQVRGSIPVFWEQTAGLQQKINITRSSQATQPAFDKHFEVLEAKYGSVHVVNLLSKEKPNEIELSSRYRKHIEHSSINREQAAGSGSDHQLIKNTEYDFHAETRGPNGYEAASMIRSYIIDSAEASGYCLTELVDDHAKGDAGEALIRRSIMVLQQHGVFRTNCLDCLDRTNLVQTIISQLAVEAFLDHRGERISAELLARHNSLWADNGDALSKIYAGTGALKSSFTRSGKMSLAGALADARKSAQRLYINNFADKGRQVTIDTLLGRLVGQTPVYLFDPINDYVTGELARRASEYSSTTEISIWCGTLNLNGRTNGLNTDLSPWLFPSPSPTTTSAGAASSLNSDGFHDIFAVGFQEIVELSPGQIMSTNPARRQAWEDAVKKTLNARASAHSAEGYVLLRGGQLVGASLSIFVRSSLLSSVKNVEGALQKTGMSGMAGNKGAVAIRMDVSATSLCFVTAHLAAGFANYDERNRDYRTIATQLRFQHGRRIADHANVLWAGDFNYRVGLPEAQVKQLIAARDLAHLYENDQLNLQMVAGLAFPHYAEARIAFPPTYKYDVGSDVYDSSDKARIPAWCDRVLRLGHGLRQTAYDHVPSLKFSDHRPVYATFVCRVDVVDERRRDRLSRELYERRKEAVGGAAGSSNLLDVGRPSIELVSDIEDDELLGALPPASGDKRKWWIDNGMPVRSTVQAPSSSATLNPARPSNPFAATDQPDWLTSSPPRKALPGSGASSRQVSAAESTVSSLSRATTSNGHDGETAVPPLPAIEAQTLCAQALLLLAHPLGLDAEVDPHPAARDLGQLKNEDGALHVDVVEQVRAQLHAPGDSQEKVDADDDVVDGGGVEDAAVAQAVRFDAHAKEENSPQRTAPAAPAALLGLHQGAADEDGKRRRILGRVHQMHPPMSMAHAVLAALHAPELNDALAEADQKRQRHEQRHGDDAAAVADRSRRRVRPAHHHARHDEQIPQHLGVGGERVGEDDVAELAMLGRGDAADSDAAQGGGEARAARRRDAVDAGQDERQQDEDEGDVAQVLEAQDAGLAEAREQPEEQQRGGLREGEQRREAVGGEPRRGLGVGGAARVLYEGRDVDLEPLEALQVEAPEDDAEGEEGGHAVG